MAPRLDGLDDKTLYLVDLHFNDSATLLGQMQTWFAQHMPQTNTIVVQKAGQMTDDDPELFQQISEQGDGMIMAVGH